MLFPVYPTINFEVFVSRLTNKTRIKSDAADTVSASAAFNANFFAEHAADAYLCQNLRPTDRPTDLARIISTCALELAYFTGNAQRVNNSVNRMRCFETTVTSGLPLRVFGSNQLMVTLAPTIHPPRPSAPKPPFSSAEDNRSMQLCNAQAILVAWGQDKSKR